MEPWPSMALWVPGEPGPEAGALRRQTPAQGEGQPQMGVLVSSGEAHGRHNPVKGTASWALDSALAQQHLPGVL